MSKDNLIEAILFFADKYDNLEAYNYLIQHSDADLPKIVSMIVYQLFINEFSYYSAEPIDYKHYRTILSYCNELKLKGYVNFS